MGTTRIKVIDLSSTDQEQIKTSRKRAVKGLVGEIKKPLIKKEGAKQQAVKEEKELTKGEIEEKIEYEKIIPEKEEINKKKKIVTRTRGKNYKNATLLVTNKKLYPVEEAIDVLKKTSFEKFNASCEVHIILKQKGVRGTVTLPYGTGKETKVLVFGPNDKTSKGIIWGDEETIEKISKGELKPQKDFNLVLAVPEFMPKLAKIAKILGPRGLMPNPKSGTIITDPQAALKKISMGQIEYKSEDKSPIIHTIFGKISFNQNQLKDNLCALVASIGIQKIKKLFISSTMGPSIKVDPLSFSLDKH